MSASGPESIEERVRRLPPLLTLSEFCAVTGLKARQVWELRQAGQIEAFQVNATGYHKYYKADALRVAGFGRQTTQNTERTNDNGRTGV